ncbi:MAG: hypothetical protein GY722_08480 [bacterium]|nr:hypothetical protein [bacterium]
MGATLACADGRAKTDLAQGTVAVRRSTASSGCAMVEAKKPAEAFAGDDVAGAAAFLGLDQLVPDALVIPFAVEQAGDTLPTIATAKIYSRFTTGGTHGAA